MGNKYSKDELVDNQNKANIKYSGDLTSYAAMLGDSFKLKVDWLGQLIHDSHFPSIGVYKERLLRSVINDFIPKRYEVGTGFVLFPNKQLYKVGDSERDGNNHEVSSQLDLIVYNSTDFPIVFRDQDFVVVRPESVRSIIEVKGSLTSKDVDETIDSYIDFGMKWKRCSNLYEKTHGPKLHMPRLMLMAWAVAFDDKGYPKSDGERLRKQIVKKYKEIPKTEIQGLPKLDSAYIYNDCRVDFTVQIGNDGVKLGYGTSRGQLVRYDKEGQPEIAGDKTIASLLANVQFSVDNPDTPFNSMFSHVDQTNRGDILTHKYNGFECWLEGDDTKLIKH